MQEVNPNLFFAVVLILVVALVITKHPKEQNRSKRKERLPNFDFDVSGDQIEVANEHAIIRLSKREFNLFVIHTGKLETVLDYNDYRQPDGHGQESGTMDIEDYWLQDDYIIKQDIAEYLNQLF